MLELSSCLSAATVNLHSAKSVLKRTTHVQPLAQGDASIQVRIKKWSARKGKKMKALTTTLGMLAALSLIASANAEVITKGGAGALLRGPVVRTERNATMACGKCKSEFTTRTERAPKGAELRKVFVEHHLCASCKTTIVTRGVGKAKADVTKHECGMSTASACCANKS
jgi:hypothetical protein